MVVYKWSSPPSGLYVGVHVDGLKPKGKRGPYGFSTPHTPPMSTQDRLGAGACAEIRARGGTSGSGDARTARAPSRPSHSGGPVDAVVARCGQRHAMRDAAYAPLIE